MRRMRRKPGSNTRIEIPARVLVGRRKDCPILAALHPDRQISWVPVHARRLRRQIKAEQFSLIDNPIRVFQTLHTIARAESECVGLTIDFTDEQCLDVSAYLILGLMKQNMIRVIEGGLITPVVRSMLDAVDLAPFIGIRSANFSSGPTFMPFSLRSRRPAGSSHSANTAFQPSRAEKIADDLVDTINRWLAVCQRPPLTKQMMGYVARLVTEVLDNAVRHSDLVAGDGDWAVAGFLSAWSVAEHPGRTSFMCSLGIVSVGATIHESLSQCADPATLARLTYYKAKHAWFARSQKARDDHHIRLSTVFALQDGVSRFSQDDGAARGGVGLMDTVQFTNDISAAKMTHEQPVVTLVSGNACLHIRGNYGKPTAGPGQPREIWFNPSNSLEQPPKTDYVFSLPQGFPGTVVALRFCVGASDDDSVLNRNIQ
jgi:hypothetical protein